MVKFVGKIYYDNSLVPAEESKIPSGPSQGQTVASRYETNMVLDKENLKKAKEANLKVYDATKTIPGKFIKPTSNLENPPIVTKTNREPWDKNKDGLLGNGSVVAIAVAAWDHGGVFSKGLLKKMVVKEHVPYGDDGSELDDEYEEDAEEIQEIEEEDELEDELDDNIEDLIE